MGLVCEYFTLVERLKEKEEKKNVGDGGYKTLDIILSSLHDEQEAHLV